MHSPLMDRTLPTPTDIQKTEIAKACSFQSRTRRTVSDERHTNTKTAMLAHATPAKPEGIRTKNKRYATRSI